ncbi:MAG TPA: hypothetical protein VNW99_05760 [Cytophagaceae bacterium]|jgi:hypothetical protein|nr:hypothetical protein [Cytophagaceae bacterium]
MYKLKFCLLLAILPSLFLILTAFKEGEKDTIIIGSGGGFSGLVTIYTIDYKGNVFLESGVKDEIKQFGIISKKDLSKIKKEIKKSGFYEQTLRDPGNIYYYIETVSNGKNHKVTWGKEQSDASAKMQQLHKFILDIISKSKK